MGDNKIVPIDMWIISVTNKNLEELIQERKFREDLLYRLNVLEPYLPPLKEREEDVPRLIGHYIKKNYPEITSSKGTVTLLQEDAYPGNIRQFFDLLERTIVLSKSTCIRLDCLEGVIRHRPATVSDTRAAVVPLSPRESVMEYEREKIQELLARSDGSRAQTAAELNIGTTTFWRKVKKYRLIP